jgi:hypothetical protein
VRELAMRAVDPTPTSRSDRGSPAPPTPRCRGPRRHPDRGPRASRSPAAWTASGARGRRRGRAPGTLWRAASRPRQRRRSAPAARAWPRRSSARGAGRKARALPSPVQRQLDRELLQRLGSRSFAARNSSSSAASADAGRPGFAEANAASAASFANARNLMITLTSTPYFRAASACEISCEVTSRKRLFRVFRGCQTGVSRNAGIFARSRPFASSARDLRVSRALTQRVEHRAPGLAEDVGDHAVELDPGVPRCTAPRHHPRRRLAARPARAHPERFGSRSAVARRPRFLR